MSLLTMMTQAVNRLSNITTPTAVVSSTDQIVKTLLALANEEGQELSARYPWQNLINEASFTTVATASQGSILTVAGASFRYIVNETIWNRTQRRPIFGPLTGQQWQTLQATAIQGPWYQFRIRGNLILFVPVPSAGQSCYFEWVSNAWSSNSGGTVFSSTWQADTDIGLIPEEIMTQGIIWRYKQSQGLQYAEDFNKYERMVEDAMGRDGGKQKLNMGEYALDVYPGVIVPSGNWMTS
jgi:hypothetical protein